METQLYPVAITPRACATAYGLHVTGVYAKMASRVLPFVPLGRADEGHSRCGILIGDAELLVPSQPRPKGQRQKDGRDSVRQALTDRRVLTATEVARVLSIDRRLLNHHLAHNGLPSFWEGKQRWVLPDDLIAWLLARRVPARWEEEAVRRTQLARAAR